MNLKRCPYFISFFSILALLAAAFVFLPLPGQVPVLLYHFVGTREDAKESKNFVSRESFARQMGFLKLFRYRIITMEDYFALRAGERKPQGREILITFDDGNTSFEKEAFPVLQRHAFASTIFIVSESIKRELNGSMSEAAIETLHKTGLVTLAGHTKTHPNLTQLDSAALAEELAGSKRDLEAMFEVPFQEVAYPKGEMDERVLDAAKKAGYRLGFTTSPKKLGRSEQGLYSIPRVKISRTADNPLIFWVKISGLYQMAKGLRHRLGSYSPGY